MYDLINLSKAYIPNLRPLGPPLHVEKFVWWWWWWWVVCKVILVFHFGPDLGLKWKTWAKLNNISIGHFFPLVSKNRMSRSFNVCLVVVVLCSRIRARRKGRDCCSVIVKAVLRLHCV